MWRMWIQNQYLLGAELRRQVVTWNISVSILVKNVDTIIQPIGTLEVTFDDVRKVSWPVEFCSSDVMFGQKFLTLTHQGLMWFAPRRAQRALRLGLLTKTIIAIDLLVFDNSVMCFVHLT